MSLHMSFAGQPLNQAPALVLLHGWGMHSEIWLPLCEHLKEEFALILIDLPGHGRSTALPEECSLNALVGQVHAGLQQAGVTQAVWLGWSLGGVVAMAYAQAYRENVTSLITLCTSPCFVARTDWAAGMDADTFTQFSDAFKAMPQKTLQRFAMLQVQGSGTAKQDLKQLKKLINSVTEPDYAALSKVLEILEGDYRELYATLDQPGFVTHLLCHLDTLAPAAIAEYLHSQTHTRVAVLDEQSHVPMLSASELLAKRIRDCLK